VVLPLLVDTPKSSAQLKYKRKTTHKPWLDVNLSVYSCLGHWSLFFGICLLFVIWRLEL